MEEREIFSTETDRSDDDVNNTRRKGIDVVMYLTLCLLENPTISVCMFYGLV